MKSPLVILIALPTLAVLGVIDLDDTQTNLAAAGFPSSPSDAAGAPIPDPAAVSRLSADGAVGDGLVYSIVAAGLTAGVLVGIKRRKVRQ